MSSKSIIDWCNLPKGEKETLEQVDMVQSLLEHLDPALFQSVILGMLAVFVPISIAFIAPIISNGSSRYTRRLFMDEVLRFKLVFWTTLVGLTIFAFFDDEGGMGQTKKTIGLFLFIPIITLMTIPFKNLLEFVMEGENKFLTSFFSPSKRRLKNKKKSKIIVENWMEFWNEFLADKTISSARGNHLAELFTTHVSYAMKVGREKLAVEISESLLAQKSDRKTEVLQNKCFIENVFKWEDQMYIAYRSWVDGGRKVNIDNWAPWHYFESNFFKAILRALLPNHIFAYDLFERIKERAEELSRDSTSKGNQRLERFIGNFCEVFFCEIRKSSNRHEIWNFYFPNEWKLTPANSKNKGAKTVFKNFKKWMKEKVVEAKKEGIDLDKDLVEVITELFPNVDVSIFPSFLMASVYHFDVKRVVKENQPFFIFHVDTYTPGRVDVGKEIAKRNEERIENTKETIKGFFEPELRYVSDYKLIPEMREAMSSKEVKAICENDQIASAKRDRMMLMIDQLDDLIKDL